MDNISWTKLEKAPDFKPKAWTWDTEMDNMKYTYALNQWWQVSLLLNLDKSEKDAFIEEMLPKLTISDALDMCNSMLGGGNTCIVVMSKTEPLAYYQKK